MADFLKIYRAIFYTSIMHNFNTRNPELVAMTIDTSKSLILTSGLNGTFSFLSVGQLGVSRFFKSKKWVTLCKMQ